MIRRTYFVKVKVMSKFGDCVGSSWRVKGLTSFFAQPVKVLNYMLEDIQSKHPGMGLSVEEFRKV